MSHATVRTAAPAAPTATAVVLPGIVEPDGLQIVTRPLPDPGPGQARVAVEATGVSFAEQQMRRGKYYDQPPFPFVPGYDLVGTVTAVGPDVDPGMIGRRHAAITKTGAWATETLVDVVDLVPVPDEVDPVEAETLVVNGLTAWQMLHRVARVQTGQTILVLGANGGVGSTLVQLARHAGARVIGTASARHHDAVRALGAMPVDRRDPDLPAALRALAPGGVDAVFDHVGGPGIVDSYRLLAPGGTLVSYGTAATKDVDGSSRLPVLALVARLLWWNALPNGRRAHFFSLWAGRRDRTAFAARVREDLAQVFALLAAGELRAQVAARLPLDDVAGAMRLAESGTVTGKVVLVPRHSGRGETDTGTASARPPADRDAPPPHATSTDQRVTGRDGGGSGGPARRSRRVRTTVVGAVVALLAAACGADTSQPTGNVAAGAASGDALSVVMVDGQFRPTTLEATAGETVTVEIVNEDSDNHDFAIPSLDLNTGTVEPGATATATFVAPDGPIEYVCTFHGGMTGTIEPA